MFASTLILLKSLKFKIYFIDCQFSRYHFRKIMHTIFSHFYRSVPCVTRITQHQKSSLRPQPSDFRPQTSDFQLPTSDFKLQTSSFRPQTSDFRPQTSDFKFQPSDFSPQTSDFIPQTSDLRPHPSESRRLSLPSIPYAPSFASKITLGSITSTVCHIPLGT